MDQNGLKLPPRFALQAMGGTDFSYTTGKIPGVFNPTATTATVLTIPSIGNSREY